MINSVDYRTDNSHKKLEGTDAFIDKIVEAENDKIEEKDHENG